MVSVLFVCMANICRSPAAEAIFRALVSQDPSLDNVHVESCGIGGWSAGQPPDARMQHAAGRRGIVLEGKAQQFTLDFYDRFDYIMAIDHEVLDLLQRHVTKPQHRSKVLLISQYSSKFQSEGVPDPYRHGESAFDDVMDMLEDCCQGLFLHIKRAL